MIPSAAVHAVDSRNDFAGYAWLAHVFQKPAHDEHGIAPAYIEVNVGIASHAFHDLAVPRLTHVSADADQIGEIPRDGAEVARSHVDRPRGKTGAKVPGSDFAETT